MALSVAAAVNVAAASTLRASTSPTPSASPSPRPTPSPSPPGSASASPGPTPRYRLIPYAFGNEGIRAEPTESDLLRFEDRTDVRALEMNEAIARFFEDRETFHRGATGGRGVAPSLAEMKEHRPGVTEGLNLMMLPQAVREAIRSLRRWREGRQGMPPAEPNPSPSPEDSPSVVASPSTAAPTPTPTPTPTPAVRPPPRPAAASSF